MSENEERKSIGVCYPGEGTSGSTLVLAPNYKRPEQSKNLRKNPTILKTLQILRPGDEKQTLAVSALLKDPLGPMAPLADFPYFFHSWDEASATAAIALHRGLRESGSVVGLVGFDSLMDEHRNICRIAVVPKDDESLKFENLDEHHLAEPALGMQLLVEWMFHKTLKGGTSVAILSPALVFLAAWGIKGFLESDRRVLGAPFDGFRMQLCRYPKEEEQEEENPTFVRIGGMIRYGTHLRRLKEQAALREARQRLVNVTWLALCQKPLAAIA